MFDSTPVQISSSNSPAGWSVATAVYPHLLVYYSPRGAVGPAAHSVSIREHVGSSEPVGAASGWWLLYDLGREAVHRAPRDYVSTVLHRVSFRIFSTQHDHGSVSQTEWPLCGEPPIEEVGYLYSIFSYTCTNWASTLDIPSEIFSFRKLTVLNPYWLTIKTMFVIFILRKKANAKRVLEDVL